MYLVLEYLQASPVLTNSSVPSSQSLVVYADFNRTVMMNRMRMTNGTVWCVNQGTPVNAVMNLRVPYSVGE